MSTGVLRIRLPAWERLLCITISVLAIGYAGALVVLDWSAAMLVPLFAGAMFLRFSRLEVSGEADRLVVRNTLRTRRIPRSRVRAFEIRKVTPVNQEIRATLADGTMVKLKVTYRATLGSLSAVGLVEDLAALNGWLRSPG
jgi:uncharacterized membrane protein YdbT with pleckstrin-like domain